ncbi:MAG: NlpC/P60 family protein [Chitinophagaceae bacterium]|nr:MAG: NlpC/P60 family protein [Chitinophagaceae bacterium]
MNFRVLFLGAMMILTTGFVRASEIEKYTNADTTAVGQYEGALDSGVSLLKIKYAEMLNIDPAYLNNIALLATLDDWFGTRYVYGGTTKRGIDCSAFTREMYRGSYNIELPRTAREQYATVRKISAVDLKEGDLVFFNTTGGVSHVGIYLSNNKFAHASSKKGVTISDLYESFYLNRFIGAGRLQEKEEPVEAIYSKLLN